MPTVATMTDDTTFVRPAKGQAACVDCGTGLFWAGVGKRPTKCPACSGKPRRHDPDRELVPVPAEASRQSKTRGARARGEERATASGDVWSSRRLAVMLGFTSDERLAARMAGVAVDGREPTDDELAELVASARHDDLQALREGRPTETAAITNRFLLLNALSMLEQEPLLTIAQRAGAARMAQQVLDALGGGKLIWPEVHVHLGAPRTATADAAAETNA